MSTQQFWAHDTNKKIDEVTITYPGQALRTLRAVTPQPPDLDALLTDCVERYPLTPAVIDVTADARNTLTYRQLDVRVNATVTAFADAGLVQSDRVVILLDNHHDFVVALLACWRARLIAVPVNVRSQTHELLYIINHCQASCLIVEPTLIERLPAAQDTPSVTALWHRDQLSAGIANPTSTTTITQPQATDTDTDTDTAIILYTSGTTGQPKGAMLSHFALLQSALQYRECLDLKIGERSIMAVPASHITGITANILSMMIVAGTTIILDKFEAELFVTTASSERMTHTVMVPAMYNLCMLRTTLADYDLSDWRVGGYGGAPMPEATIEALADALPALSIANIYGATETAGPCTLMPFGHTQGRTDSVGVALPCCDLKVIDPASNTEALVGETGELWIKGPGVTSGYWADDNATQQAIVDAGWWRSGDVASIDADGYVRIVDRLKDMINRGGYKVYSVEVENALNYHPQVIESAVVAVDDPVLGEKTHAFICTDNPSLSSEDLKKHCANRLSDYKHPDFYTLSSDPLPRNANGKLLKRQLRAPPVS